MSVQIVVTGNSVKDVANRMRELADEMYKPTTKKIAAEVEEDDEDESEEAGEENEDDIDAEDEEDEDEAIEEDDEDSDEEEKPAVKKGKVKKLTANDVNDACKSLASSIGGKKGREKVLSILKKKFKTESVSELKPEQYAKCIAAMEDAE